MGNILFLKIICLQYEEVVAGKTKPEPVTSFYETNQKVDRSQNMIKVSLPPLYSFFGQDCLAYNQLPHGKTHLISETHFVSFKTGSLDITIEGILNTLHDVFRMI